MFPVSHTASVKAASDLRNVSTMTQMKKSRKNPYYGPMYVDRQANTTANIQVNMQR